MSKYLKLPAFIGLLLGLLGFASCNSSENDIPPPAYGLPPATFKVTGTVIDEDSRDPVEGLIVKFYGYNSAHRPDGVQDSGQTDAEGNFTFESYGGRWANYKLRVTDPLASPRYEPAIKDFEYSEFVQDASDEFKYVYRAGNITVKKTEE